MHDGFEQYAAEIRRGLNEDIPAAEAAALTLSTISAVDLQRKDIAPIRWIVQDLIPAGLSILASPPKYGKSWAVLDMGLSVAAGNRFLGYQTVKSGCLYLALEDSERRLKSRLDKLLVERTAPDSFYFATSSHDLDNGLIAELESFLYQHPDIGLIVVDTFQKVRGAVRGREANYASDYRETGMLKAFADAHNIALLLVHHLRKLGDAEDPFNRISGTNGIAGASDTMMVLTKEKRDDDTATFSVVGRDVESSDTVLRFNKHSCRWENLGDAASIAEQHTREQYQSNPIVRTVKRLLEQSPTGWSGTSQDLLSAGMFIGRARLASSPRELSNALKELSPLLFEYDSIIYTRARNGTGGGKHKFSTAVEPTFEDIEISEHDPF